MSNRSTWSAIFIGVLVICLLGGCLSVPNVPTDEASQTEGTMESTPAAGDCPPILQTDLASSEEIEQSNESVTSFEELSEAQQELFRRAYHNTSYEVQNVPETVVMDMANKIIRYNNSTYRLYVMIC